uniref:CC71L protein n=1 Tax=Macrostomum lignano TaxID=282301 RepID=A0A1I8FIA7_9PLAT
PRRSTCAVTSSIVERPRQSAARISTPKSVVGSKRSRRSPAKHQSAAAARIILGWGGGASAAAFGQGLAEPLAYPEPGEDGGTRSSGRERKKLEEKRSTAARVCKAEAAELKA